MGRGSRSRRRLLQGGLALAGVGLLAGCGRGTLLGQPGEAPAVGFRTGNSEAAALASSDDVLPITGVDRRFVGLLEALP
jgi:hypothetical protein